MCLRGTVNKIIYFFFNFTFFKTCLQFLATSFILEFTIACMWTPIDVLIVTALPEILCNVTYSFFSTSDKFSNIIMKNNLLLCSDIHEVRI